MPFLLPCPCGKEIPIEPRQAGEEITCQCGQQLTVPTMREIRQLPSTGERVEPSLPRWSARQGWFFSVGSVLALVCVLTIAFLSYQRKIFHVEKPRLDYERLHAHYEEHTDTPSKALRVWNDLVAKGLPEPTYEPYYRENRRRADRNMAQIVAAAILAVVGLALAAAAFFISPTPPAHRPAGRRHGDQPA